MTTFEVSQGRPSPSLLLAPPPPLPPSPPSQVASLSLSSSSTAAFERCMDGIRRTMASQSTHGQLVAELRTLLRHATRRGACNNGLARDANAVTGDSEVDKENCRTRERGRSRSPSDKGNNDGHDSRSPLSPTGLRLSPLQQRSLRCRTRDLVSALVDGGSSVMASYGVGVVEPLEQIASGFRRYWDLSATSTAEAAAKTCGDSGSRENAQVSAASKQLSGYNIYPYTFSPNVPAQGDAERQCEVTPFSSHGGAAAATVTSAITPTRAATVSLSSSMRGDLQRIKQLAEQLDELIHLQQDALIALRATAAFSPGLSPSPAAPFSSPSQQSSCADNDLLGTTSTLLRYADQLSDLGGSTRHLLGCLASELTHLCNPNPYNDDEDSAASVAAKSQAPGDLFDFAGRGLSVSPLVASPLMNSTLRNSEDRHGNDSGNHHNRTTSGRCDCNAAPSAAGHGDNICTSLRPPVGDDSVLSASPVVEVSPPSALRAQDADAAGAFARLHSPPSPVPPPPPHTPLDGSRTLMPALMDAVDTHTNTGATAATSTDLTHVSCAIYASSDGDHDGGTKEETAVACEGLTAVAQRLVCGGTLRDSPLATGARVEKGGDARADAAAASPQSSTADSTTAAHGQQHSTTHNDQREEAAPDAMCAARDVSWTASRRAVSIDPHHQSHRQEVSKSGRGRALAAALSSRRGGVRTGRREMKHPRQQRVLDVRDTIITGLQEQVLLLLSSASSSKAATATTATTASACAPSSRASSVTTGSRDSIASQPLDYRTAPLPPSAPHPLTSNDIASSSVLASSPFFLQAQQQQWVWQQQQQHLQELEEVQRTRLADLQQRVNDLHAEQAALRAHIQNAGAVAPHTSTSPSNQESEATEGNHDNEGENGSKEAGVDAANAVAVHRQRLQDRQSQRWQRLVVELEVEAQEAQAQLEDARERCSRLQQDNVRLKRQLGVLEARLRAAGESGSNGRDCIPVADDVTVSKGNEVHERGDEGLLHEMAWHTLRSHERSPAVPTRHGAAQLSKSQPQQQPKLPLPSAAANAAAQLHAHDAQGLSPLQQKRLELLSRLQSGTPAEGGTTTATNNTAIMYPTEYERRSCVDAAFLDESHGESPSAAGNDESRDEAASDDARSQDSEDDLYSCSSDTDDDSAGEHASVAEARRVVRRARRLLASGWRNDVSRADGATASHTSRHLRDEQKMWAHTYHAASHSLSPPPPFLHATMVDAAQMHCSRSQRNSRPTPRVCADNQGINARRWDSLSSEKLTVDRTPHPVHHGEALGPEPVLLSPCAAVSYSATKKTHHGSRDADAREVSLSLSPRPRAWQGQQSEQQQQYKQLTTTSRSSVSLLDSLEELKDRPASGRPHVDVGTSPVHPLRPSMWGKPARNGRSTRGAPFQEPLPPPPPPPSSSSSSSSSSPPPTQSVSTITTAATNATRRERRVRIVTPSSSPTRPEPDASVHTATPLSKPVSGAGLMEPRGSRHSREGSTSQSGARERVLTQLREERAALLSQIADVEDKAEQLASKKAELARAVADAQRKATAAASARRSGSGDGVSRGRKGGGSASNGVLLQQHRAQQLAQVMARLERAEGVLAMRRDEAAERLGLVHRQMNGLLRDDLL